MVNDISRQNGEDSSAQLTHHSEYHQAVGIVVAQLDLDPIDAEAHLLDFARTHGLPVPQLASDLVARRLTFAPPERE